MAPDHYFSDDVMHPLLRMSIKSGRFCLRRDTFGFGNESRLLCCGQNKRYELDPPSEEVVCLHSAGFCCRASNSNTDEKTRRLKMGKHDRKENSLKIRSVFSRKLTLLSHESIYSIWRFLTYLLVQELYQNWPVCTLEYSKCTLSNLLWAIWTERTWKRPLFTSADEKRKRNIFDTHCIPQTQSNHRNSQSRVCQHAS